MTTEIHVHGRYVFELRLGPKNPIRPFADPRFTYGEPNWMIVGILVIDGLTGELSCRPPEPGDRDYDEICKQAALYHAAKDAS